MHALDQALMLEPAGPGRFRGKPPLDYWNMVGPYGGITAAILLKAVLADSRHQGEPLVLTVNFCAPVREAEFELILRPVRSNRSTQHWHVEMQQTDITDAGTETLTVAQALVVLGRRRDVWQQAAPNPPVLPPADTLRPRALNTRIRWFERYDVRLVGNPMKNADPTEPVLSWLRDNPARALDYPALVGLADTFYPGIFAHRKAYVPIATVSMNVYFHVSAEQLAAIGPDWLAGRTGSNVFRGGFFDCESQIWHRESLIVTTHQVMWYRE